MAQLSHHATILPVTDMQRSLDFYTKKLDFTCSFTWEEPVSYAVLKRDRVSIHLALQDKVVIAPENVMCYIFCEDVESVYKALQNRQVSFEESLNQADYGMKEFVIKDPQGFRIAFGQEVGQ